MVKASDRLEYVHSDIRGPLYQEALRMESEGTIVLKLILAIRRALALPCRILCVRHLHFISMTLWHTAMCAV